MVAHGAGPIVGETQAVEEILGPGPLLSPDFPITLEVPDVSGGALALYPMRHTTGLAPHPHRNEVIVTIEDTKGTTLAHANFDGTNQDDLFFLPGVGIIASEDHRARVFDVKYSDDGELVNLRWVLAHLLEETARHAGHADILRELVDGSTGR